MKNRILSYLDELFPNAKAELIYNKDYELLISIMLSAQAKDKVVNQVTSVLYNKYDSLDKLASANQSDIATILKPLGTYNIKAANIVKIATALKKYDKIPANIEFLKSLPGIGHKSASLFLAMIYDMPYFAVDTHVTRVSKRLNLVAADADVLKIEKELEKLFKGEKIIKIHHQFVLFGRYFCTAKNPKCDGCKLKSICKFK